MNKKIIASFLFLLSVLLSVAQVGISTTSITPDASSMLEIRSTNTGVLIPRVALSATTVAAPVAAPANSLLIFNTATAGDVTPGFYYWDGTKWVRLLSGAMPADAWKLIGNAGTVATTNFIGTTDAIDFVTRTNNAERSRILSAGNVLINRTTALYATDLFEAQGNATFPDAVNGYTDQAAGTGVFGGNTAATGAGAGCGVYGLSAQTGGSGVFGDGDLYTAGTIGYTEAAGFDGVFGLNAATTGAGIGAGVYGESGQTGAAGVWGAGGTLTRGVMAVNNNATYAAAHAQNSAAGGDAVYAVNNAAAGTGVGTGVYASSNQYGCATIMSVLVSTSYYANCAVSAYNGTTYETVTPKAIGAGVLADDGIAIMGVNTAAAGTATGDGIDGITYQSNGLALYGLNGHTSGTGVMGIGNNASGSYLTSGSGGAFTGTTVGSYDYGTAAVSTGTMGVGNAQTGYTLSATGSGGAFTGLNFGVYGKANSSANDSWGGYFVNGVTGAYVGGRTGGTNYAILSTGTKSTIVKDPNNKEVVMFCPEAPEVLFQDYGIAKLVNGKAHVDMDPVFTNAVYVSEDHPMKVFIQLEGDCNGVYVSNKTATGFDVTELQGGTSTVSFSWTVVANRADEKDAQGNVTSKFVDVRFPAAPGRLEEKPVTTSERAKIDVSTQMRDNSKQNITSEKNKKVVDSKKK
ncbi:MAG: hypothetical protein A2W93_11680 [Bacteroidetes bacterium GWF2_43_63]|nr:MAG: hypothetical protein A2W94_14550 [Bacteroidetes bacterium GWE2_42_42]OFY54928.1 MAG: hypothetical protein A2W93_11680 [Bacteroidetes bacterium GWF2_43_63]HCB63162.1 hypothetical protein [Bacteroidales bacterium]HCY22233.1 hypothetical protein [Bacteroidales bacterium]